MGLGLSSATAGVVNILSGVDLLTESNSITGTNVILTGYWTEPVWKNPTMGGRWISYAQTGPGGLDVSNTTTAGPASAVFTETFVLPSVALAGSSVSFWADDTAQILLDGVLMIDVGASIRDIWCVSNSIGCQPSKLATLDLTGVAAGSHTLTINVYQLYDNAFGVLYEGSAIFADIPEPSTFALLPLGLASLLLIRRRRRG